MLIGKKFNFLIVGVIAAIFIAIGVFVIIYIPVVNMRIEKESIFKLDSAVSELRADINKLGNSTFDSQIEDIIMRNDTLIQQFEHLKEVKYLKSDPEIDEALKIIARLYTLYEVNYVRLMDTREQLGPHLRTVFLSEKLKIDDIKSSRMLQRYAERDTMLALIDSTMSIMSILDSNLVSTHMVVEEKFAIIGDLIAKRENSAYIFGVVLIIIVGIAAFIAAILFSGKITKNIQIAGIGIKKMSTGDISNRFDIKTKDELGELGENLNTLTDSLKSAFQSMKTSSNKGVELKEELITSANQTSAAAEEIAINSQAISNQFSMLSERVSAATEANQSMKSNLHSLEEYVQEQSAMVEESTSAVTEMISSINNVTEITTKKKAATDVLVKTAESGGNKLSATIKVISDINASLDEIKGTATIIQQIASQTNLLAMNAAIEAAHAGDAGRGFAVVADEIRKLAEASSMNSKQISGVLKDVVSKIESASASGHDTEAAFFEIDREVSGVAQSLDEISSSMDELNIGGKQILEAMSGLQDVSVQVNQGSGMMSEASEKVTEAIEIVSRITTEVANSANEITIGITEVSGAMQLVTDLSENLGDITDKLEKEAACFKTEYDAEAEEGCFDDNSTDETSVTISDDDKSGADIEII